MNRCLVFGGLVFGGLVAPMVLRADEPPVERDSGPLVAYAWTPEAGQFPHIVPMYWLVHGRDLNDPSPAKQATDAMPEGHRVLFLWDFQRDLHRHPDDRCRDPDGVLTETPGIWWDAGVARLSERLDQWFGEFKAGGGRVDTVVLDYESNFSNWALGNNAEIYQAIMADPRFEAVAEQLGFDDLTRVQNWRSGDWYLRWNALMRRRQADYISEGVYEPIRKHFPDVRFSNYYYNYNSQEYPCPDRFGHDISPFGGGKHVGTHQAPPLYGSLAHVSLSHIQDGRLVQRGRGPRYGDSPFCALRFSVNLLRSSKLSANVPLMPWISHKRYRESRLRDGDLYQELIFHVGLTGPDALLYWNPGVYRNNQNPEHFTSREQEQLLGDCLVEFNDLTSASPRESLVTELAGWAEDYILTGMRTGERSVWRFTPDVADGESVNSTILREAPATFRTESMEISIPQGVVQRPDKTVSESGVWVIAPGDARPLTDSR